MAGALSEAEFRNLLENEVEQRARQYNHIRGFALRYEADDTQASHDAQHFHSILKILGAPAAEELVVQASDPTPNWTVNDRFKARLSSLHAKGGRKLLLVHYAGHGMTSSNGDLVFFACYDKMDKFLPFDQLRMLVDAIDKNDPLDVLFILDSCYSGLATRQVTPSARIVQVLAAVEGDQTAFGNNQHNPRKTNKTFTSKIADYIARERGAKADSIDFGDLIAAIAAGSPQKKPVHKVLQGPTSIRARLPSGLGHASGHSRKSSNSGVGKSNYRAVLGVHIADDLSAEQAKELGNWVRTLDPEYGITVEGVYKTNSVLVILNVPYGMFVGLESLPGIELVSGVFGRNLVAGPAPEGSPLAARPPNRKENYRPDGPGSGRGDSALGPHTPKPLR